MGEHAIDELEFENAQLHVDLNLTRFDGCMLMFDQLLSMYTHVQNYGIDRTFLVLYNNDNQLNDICNMKFPACESILSDYELNQRYFEACMEGLGSAISSLFNWVIEKIKGLFSWIGEMWSKFIGLFKSDEVSAKTRSKVEKLRNSKLVKQIEVAVASNRHMANIEPIIKECDKVFKNIANGNVNLADIRKLTNAHNILTALVKQGKKGKGDQEIKKIKIVSDSSKNSCLNYVLDFQTQSDKVVRALGMHISGYKNIEQQIVSNLKAQAQNIDAYKDNKKKNGFKDKELKIRDKWKAALSAIRDGVSILSKVMKYIMQGNKITQNVLHVISKAVKLDASAAIDSFKNDQKYNARHPNDPV